MLQRMTPETIDPETRPAKIPDRPDPEFDPLPRRPFAEAKAQLSALITDVHNHRPFVLDRHRGRERAIVLSSEDLGVALESFEFTPLVSVEDGGFVIRLPQLNLIAGGPTYDEALDELVDLAADYAEDYFRRLAFYMQTERRSQLPWLLRLGAAPTEEWPDLLSPVRTGASSSAEPA